MPITVQGQIVNKPNSIGLLTNSGNPLPLSTTSDSDDLVVYQNNQPVVISKSSFVNSLPSQTIATINNVQDYGAVGDGSTDDTVAIQAAITALGSKGGSIYFPPGIYVITEAIMVTVNVEFIAAGMLSVTLQSNSTTANHITCIGSNLKVDGFIFTKGFTSTSGYVIDIQNTILCLITNCRLYGGNRQFQGIRFLSTFQCSVLNVNIEGLLAEAIVITGTAIRETSDIFLNLVRVIGCQNQVTTLQQAGQVGCIRIDDYTGGLFFDQIEIFGSSMGYGIYFNTQLTHSQINGQNGLAFFSTLNMDGSGQFCGGIYCQNWGGLSITNNSWINSTDLAALNFQNTCSDININGNYSFGCTQITATNLCIVYLGGSNIQIGNCEISSPPNNGIGLYIANTCFDYNLHDILIQQCSVAIERQENYADGNDSGSIVNIKCRNNTVDFINLTENVSNISNLLSSDSYSGDIITAATEINPPCGQALVYINGTTPINTIIPRHFGQILTLMLNNSGAVLSTGGNIYTSSGNNIVALYNFYVVRLFSNGGNWYQI